MWIDIVTGVSSGFPGGATERVSRQTLRPVYQLTQGRDSRSRGRSTVVVSIRRNVAPVVVVSRVCPLKLTPLFQCFFFFCFLFRSVAIPIGYRLSCFVKRSKRRRSRRGFISYLGRTRVAPRASTRHAREPDCTSLFQRFQAVDICFPYLLPRETIEHRYCPHTRGDEYVRVVCMRDLRYSLWLDERWLGREREKKKGGLQMDADKRLFRYHGDNV